MLSIENTEIFTLVGDLEKYKLTKLRPQVVALQRAALLLASAQLDYDTDKELNENEMTILRNEGAMKKISVIKLYRERTGEGLREAKEAVEAWMTKNNIKIYTSGY